MTRDQIRAALDPRVAVTCTLLGEAAGESLLGQTAVACVIRNRVRHPRWWGGPSWRSVCTAKWQFSCWWETNANSERVYALASALSRGQAATGPMSLVGQLEWVAVGVMDDVLMDVTQGADHYLTRALYQSPQCPSWAKGKAPVAAIDGHLFFRLEI